MQLRDAFNYIHGALQVPGNKATTKELQKLYEKIKGKLNENS